MRELDLLPGWYRQRLAHRKRVMAQGWIVVALGLALSTWIVLVQGNISTARAALATLQGQLAQSKSQLGEMSVLEQRRRQWALQEQVISRLGAHVDAARLIRTLDAAMPAEISLSQLQVDTEEKKPDVAPANRSAAATNKSAARQLHVILQGVAPSDLDLANFVSRLNGVSFFEQVAVNYVKDSDNNGRIMRSFEIGFAVPLSAATGP